MARDAVLPTNATYSTLLDAFGKAGLVKEALLWLRHMRSRRVVPDEVTAGTILRILKDSGQFDQGERFFKDWCGGNSEFEYLEPDYSALDFANPTSFLLAELFKTGARAPVSRIGSASDEGIPRKPRLAATYNILIDLYGKAGRLKDASEAFAEMLKLGIAPDTITFNTMMNICGSKGCLQKQRRCSRKWLREGFPPIRKHSTYS
uniref:Pentatricopeptide repeat-containing protein n=1 Tax=Ananas comosus var. bracteatus TaxID=296719 RepID=A0A6V7Q7L6_ANACO|nr:unnamed protein product [Ananas comosus var. bracteatus]